MHTGAWRVGYYYVGPAVSVDKLLGQYVLHVAGKELCVGNAVNLRVHLCVLYGIGHIFYADNLAGMGRHEVGNGAGAGV